MIYEEEGCCLEQWCLYVHRLKSGFSRVDFGPLFIHDSWPPTRLATVWSGLDRGLFWRLLKRLDCTVQSFVGLDWTVPKDHTVRR